MTNVFDFIQAKDPRNSNPLFNFLNGGQQRRQKLNALFDNIGGTLSQFVSPRGRDQVQSIENLHNMFSPIVASGNSIQNMQQGNYGSAFMDVAGFAVPTAIVAKYGGKTAVDAAKYLSETLALSSGGMKNIGENVYEQVIGRMNQPGEMPVVGSNLGNVGHNQGPPLETRPKYIQEYSPSFRAATELPQEKGTFEQMRKMMLARGAKEDELEWSAFDKNFRNDEQVFKSEIIDYLQKNAGSNMIDEVSKTAKGILDEDSFLSRSEMVDRYIAQNVNETTKDLDELYAYADELDVTDLREQIGLGPIADSESLEMPDYASFFTKGAKDYTTKTFGYKDPEGLRRGPFATHTNEHWPEKDVMVHTRVGKFPLQKENGSVYHVGEIQSDFGQDIQANIKPQKEAIREFDKEIKETEEIIKEELFSSDFSTPEAMREHYNTLLNSKKTNQEFAKKQLERKKSATKDEVDILTNRGIALDKEYEIVRSANKFLEDNYKQIESASSDPYVLVEYNKNLSNDMYDWKFGQEKYEESRKNRVLRPPSEDEVLERNRGNAKTILDGIDLFEYLTDKNVNTPLANSFRQQKFEGENVLEAYSKIKADIKAGNDLRTGARDLSGAPLVSSTNKWVDFALRKELRNAVASGSDYMTIGSSDMVRRMTGGDSEGQKEFYGKIVPKRLEQLLKKFDKDAKVEVVEIQTAADRNIINTRPESKGQWKVLGVKLTDKLVNAMADKGMPIFNFLPGAVGLTGTGILASQAGQEDKPGGLLNQF